MPTFLRSDRELHWFNNPKLLINPAPGTKLHPWLLDKGSLTAKLILLSQGEFRVKVLRQVHARASHSEALALGIAPQQLCLVREVILLGHNQPWVFARSVLPLTSLTGKLRHLRKQGSRPLGAFLFSQPKLTRSPISLSLIYRHHQYVPAALIDDAPVWGRRSIFYVEGKPLLVSEVFLTGFPGAIVNKVFIDSANIENIVNKNAVKENSVQKSVIKEIAVEKNAV
ncbi:MAG: chorismate lyase [Pseudomonadota bacterium]